MRMLLTEEEVSEALQNYVNEQVTLKDNQEATVEIAADGSASVDIRVVGKAAARKPAARKGKAKASEPKAAKAAEPETEASSEPQAETDTSTESEPKSETEVKPTSPEPQTSPAPTKGVFSMGDRMKAPKEEAPAETKTEEAPAAEPRPTGTSIFSRV